MNLLLAEVAQAAQRLADAGVPSPRFDAEELAAYVHGVKRGELHGVADSDRSDEVTLYTGNDDHIVGDLLAVYPQGAQFVGGLLGQWAVWVRNAVDLLDLTHRAKAGDDRALREALAVDAALTDANAAIFDPENNFHGCIPGIHEVLRRQGLLAGTWCLNEREGLSPGQLAEIDRIWAAYPQLRDDQFIAENIDRWLVGGPRRAD